MEGKLVTVKDLVDRARRNADEGDEWWQRRLKWLERILHEKKEENE